MRLSIRMKMFTLVALVLVLAISAVIWKTSGTFQEDKSLFVKEFADRFTGTVARLTVDRVQSLQNSTAVFVSNRESLKNLKGRQDISKILFERFNDAFVVSVVDKHTGSWAPTWIERNSLSSAKSWPKGFDSTLVQSINFDATSSAGLFLTKLSQPNGQPAYAISFVANLQSDSGTAANQSILVAIVSTTTFEDIIKDFKGDINEVFIVDQRGYVYAHPNPQYINQNLESHPLVAEIRQQNKEGATGTYKDLDNESIIGSYRKVKGTNLFVVSTTPTKAAFKAAEILIRSVIVFGIGFGLIGIVIAIFVAGRITNPLHRLKEIAAKIGSGDFKIPVDVVSNDEVGELAKSIDQMKISLLEREEALEHSKMALIQSEKMSAFGQLSAGIAHEVKNPLAGILGHAQLAKGKTQDADLKKHIEVIEKETRRTKEIIENLMKFARAEKAELVPTDLYETVSATCDLVDHQLTLMGVKIQKKLNHVPQVKANSNQLQQVLLNISMNAGHAMEKSSIKELTIYLEEAKDCVRVRIQDTGAGMSPEVQKRIFEPFFTTKPAGKGTGLGLSVSMGIVRDHHAKIYVQSEIGKGTTFFIDFPLLDALPAKGEAPSSLATKPPPSSMPPIPKSPSPVPQTASAMVQKSVVKANGAANEKTSLASKTPRVEDKNAVSASSSDKAPDFTKSGLNEKTEPGRSEKRLSPLAASNMPSSPFSGKANVASAVISSSSNSPLTDKKITDRSLAIPPALFSKKTIDSGVSRASLLAEESVEKEIMQSASLKKAPSASKPPPIESKVGTAKSAAKALGGKAPLSEDTLLEVDRGVSRKPTFKSQLPKEVTDSNIETPPGPSDKELGYDASVPNEKEEFKVNIRRPKLKL